MTYYHFFFMASQNRDYHCYLCEIVHKLRVNSLPEDNVLIVNSTKAAPKQEKSPPLPVLNMD